MQKTCPALKASVWIAAAFASSIPLARGEAAAIAVAAEERAFMDRCARLAESAAAAERGAVAGKADWILLANELRHVGAGKFWGAESDAASRATQPEAKDPLPAILDFARQLRDLEIGLLVVPVPPKVVVYPDQLPDAAPDSGPAAPAPVRRLDPYHRAFYALLRERGLAVLDLTDALIEARQKDAEAGPVYCRHDTHWSPRGIEIAADAVARLLRDRKDLEARPRRAYSFRSETAGISGDLWTMLGKGDLTRETLAYRRVVPAPPDGESGLEPDPMSPVLLLADSHGLVFHIGGDMHTTGAGLADHLAARLGFPVDLIARRGSAATSIRIDLARRFHREPAYLKSKRFVVWCFSAREFTESAGWRALRLTPAKL